MKKELLSEEETLEEIELQHISKAMAHKAFSKVGSTLCIGSAVFLIGSRYSYHRGRIYYSDKSWTVVDAIHYYPSKRLGCILSNKSIIEEDYHPSYLKKLVAYLL